MAQVLDWTRLSTLLPLVGMLPDRYREGVALRQVNKGVAIFRRGDRPRFMFAVLSGEVRLVRSSPHGAEVILQRTRRGFLAEASLDQRAYHCDAIAAEVSEMIAIPRKDLSAALDDTLFRTQWIGHLARELRAARAHSERLSLRTARERITHYIEVEGDGGVVTLTETKKDWAASLGLTHEALYRALSQMQKDGHVSVDGATVRLTP